MLDLWKKKPIISWKKILKKYISSKKGSKINTIKRRDRRLPNRIDVKGKKTHYDVPEVVVGIDVSGSMSNEEIYKGLTEVNEICKVTRSNLKLVQIDTEIKGLEDFNENQKNFTRKGCGGTYMGVLPEYLIENKVKCDVLVMISDMFIEDIQTDKNWNKFKKPVVWLNTSGTDVSYGRGHRVFDIKNT